MLHTPTIFVPRVPPGGFSLKFGTEGFDAVGFSDGSIARGKGVHAHVLKNCEGVVVVQRAERMATPVRDSNVPELLGILSLLRSAIAQGVTRLVCCTDSYQALQAIQSAVHGKPSRYPEVSAICEHLGSFVALELRNVANRHNKVADALCTSMH